MSKKPEPDKIYLVFANTADSARIAGFTLRKSLCYSRPKNLWELEQPADFLLTNQEDVLSLIDYVNNTVSISSLI